MEEGATNKDEDLEEILVVLYGHLSMALRILLNGVMAFFQISMNFIKIDGASFAWFI